MDPMRYLGIDFGTKKVGLALSDESGAMGFPHSVLPNSPRLLAEVSALVAKENVGAIVIGESLDFSGKENPVAKDARAFGEELSKATGLPVSYEFEALTSQEASRSIDGMRERQASPVDASAAALILTSYLSRSHD